ncbi:MULTISPECIES: flagellar biosynthesis anti-sigma factor FlgM [Virgibacillus]|uniref:Negative regulator of flagellin synthesis n=2 Tax=Virgibacillus TaxID=84406 RepID=A0A024Q962_9BACI|nr:MULTISPECIES: flagellar biosynthesis anti-sigma factor FlgM [Virgibacillus]EQB37483.1 hypothetical protein M948_02760 [Virgibacillus sp. CM-4]MYL40235.1 flagellar biosynthesis anti-sigma factor FlgM [Virgibacillus massiliensis]GGJ60583.1 hypothetical protein GCM10007111_23380 [Virgibacillus kapii]CDQ38999.1 flagellar biosynthesis anti-sigma factor FlgM [Virgibacillus massiliensis]
MKINGPNQTNFNPYKQHLQKQIESKQAMRQDQLEISKQAKQLQEEEKSNPIREAHVAKIKEAVESGEYRINYEKTAEKMMDYWSGKES